MDTSDNTGFEKDDCRFILQKYDNREIAVNFMINIAASYADEFRQEVINKKLPEK